MMVTGSDAARAVARVGHRCRNHLAHLRRETVHREVRGLPDGEEAAVGSHVGGDDDLVGAADVLHHGLEERERLASVGAEPVQEHGRHASTPGR